MTKNPSSPTPEPYQPPLGASQLANSPPKRPDLRVVDRETGEVTEECQRCRELGEEVRGLETEKRGWRTRYYQAIEDQARAAQDHHLYPAAVELFRAWREKCGYLDTTTFTPDRFWTVEPFIRRNGIEKCHEAIEGAAFDPFTTTLKNGKEKRHNGWDLVFRSQDKFDDFRARAPVGGIIAPEPAPEPPGWMKKLGHQGLASAIRDRIFLYETETDAALRATLLSEIEQLIAAHR